MTSFVLTAAQALAVVLVVLAQAVVLYVGYGYLESWLGPRVINRLRHT